MKLPGFKSTKIFVIAVAFTLVLWKTGNAGLIFSIDLDPSLSGIQNTRQVSAATQVQANLFLELTETTSLDSYRTSIIFDNSGLTFVSGTPSPLANYSRQSALPLLSGNVFGPFEASSNAFGAGLSGPQGPFLVGSLLFTAQNTPGTFTIRPFEVANLDGSFDNNFNPLTPTFLGASVTISAVPEPSSFASLLFVASIGAAGSCLRKHIRQLQHSCQGLYKLLRSFSPRNCRAYFGR